MLKPDSIVSAPEKCTRSVLIISIIVCVQEFIIYIRCVLIDTYVLFVFIISAYPPAFSEKERLLCVTGPIPITDAGTHYKHEILFSNIIAYVYIQQGCI